MKRGRPSKRTLIQKNILEVLATTEFPLTTLAITRRISKKLNKKISWNTVKKYLDELVGIDKVQAIKLPHSKKEGKEGLTIYSLKK